MSPRDSLGNRNKLYSIKFNLGYKRNLYVEKPSESLVKAEAYSVYTVNPDLELTRPGLNYTLVPNFSYL